MTKVSWATPERRRKPVYWLTKQSQWTTTAGSSGGTSPSSPPWRTTTSSRAAIIACRRFAWAATSTRGKPQQRPNSARSRSSQAQAATSCATQAQDPVLSSSVVLYNRMSFTVTLLTTTDREIRIWDKTSGSLLRTFDNIINPDISCLDLDARQRKIVFGTQRDELIVLNHVNGAILKTWTPHQLNVSALIYHPLDDQHYELDRIRDFHQPGSERTTTLPSQARSLLTQEVRTSCGDRQWGHRGGKRLDLQPGLPVLSAPH